jgi:hypothetical protein
MRAPALPLIVLLALLAGSARAARLELGWDARAGWDSNVFGSSDDEDSDFSFYLGPNLGVRERGRAIDYFVDYRLRYEQYLDLQSVNGFEHFASGAVDWRLSPRSSLRVSQDFSRTRGLSLTFIEPVPGIDPVDAVAEARFRRTPRIRSNSTASFSHQLSKLWSFDTSVDASVYDYEDELQSGVLSLRGSGQFSRPLDPRTLVGFGAAVTRQDFDDTERSIGTASTIVEGFALLRYQISPTLVLALSGGPAWTQPDEASDTAMSPREGVGTGRGGVVRLIDPSRCGVLPVGGSVPPGTISQRSCPTRDIDVFPPGPSPNDIESALITDPDVVVSRSRLRFDEVDVLGDIEDPDGSFTFFGRAALTKRWRNFDGELSYVRRTSASSGLGTTNLDIATATLAWRPDRRRWRFDLRGTWTLQSSATEQPATDLLLAPTPTTVWVDSSGRVFDSFVPGAVQVDDAARVVGVRHEGFIDSGVEIETIRFELRANRRFSENLTALASVGWWRQESRGDFQEPATSDNLRVQVGFTWSLDPIEL